MLQAERVLTTQNAQLVIADEVVQASANMATNSNKVSFPEALPIEPATVKTQQEYAEVPSTTLSRKPAADMAQREYSVDKQLVSLDLPSVDTQVPGTAELSVKQSDSDAPDVLKATVPPGLVFNSHAMRGPVAEANPEVRGEKQHQFQVSVKEMTETSNNLLPAAQATLTSGDSPDRNGDQASPDQRFNSQMISSQVHEQQKTVTHSATSVLATRETPVRPEGSEQVVLQVKERLMQHDVKQGSQQITLTLSPDSLGELKMNLNLQGQKLSVEIVTENRTVRDAIVQHTDALKESLARQNITMESFDVTTGGKGSGNQGQNQNAWRELAKQQQQQQFWTSPRGYHTAQAVLPSAQATYQRQKEHLMLDIHY
ncbi:MAG: flagellar hook-length control protein FliK [Desulfuromonadales bacterium]